MILLKTDAKNLPEARMAGFRKFYDADGSIMDEGIVLCFPNPHSFTGEDVVELHTTVLCHSKCLTLLFI